MRIALVLLSLLFSCAAEGATNVWIDTDPSIGAPWREADDAFALVLAFHSPELRIAGISTTYGNVGLKRTTAVARDIVRRCGAAVSVFPGSSSRGDAAQTEATDALGRALRERPLTYIALGPLTNLATFVRQHPELASRIERVIFIGGKSAGYEPRFGRNGWLRIHDANVDKDPAAVAEILRSPIPLVLAPVETSADIVISRAEWLQLREGGPTSRFLQVKSRFWMTFWTKIVRHPGGPLFDSLGILLATHPQEIRTEIRSGARVGCELIAAQDRTRDSRPVRFATRVSARARQAAVERLRAQRFR
jgi:pyrimidine-specific ribonucleoside hydrolase